MKSSNAWTHPTFVGHACAVYVDAPTHRALVRAAYAECPVGGEIDAYIADRVRRALDLLAASEAEEAAQGERYVIAQGTAPDLPPGDVQASDPGDEHHERGWVRSGHAECPAWKRREEERVQRGEERWPWTRRDGE
jgi:hypothetical protein